jgi:hypothetical protein
VDVRNGPSVTLSGAELEPLDRQLRQAVVMFRRNRADGLAPYEFLQLAIAVNRAVNGFAAKPRNLPQAADTPASGEPAETFLSVKQAAACMEVSETWVRQLVRHGFLEVRASKGPTQIYADSVAAHQERRSRKEEERTKAA